MKRAIFKFLNRYAILDTALVPSGFALILRTDEQNLGLPAIISAVVLLLLAAFLLFIYLSNARRNRR